MAKSSNYAAYQQARPLEGDVSQDMQYWNQDAAQRRQENMQKEQFAWRKGEAERQRQDQETKERRADYDKYVKPFESGDTGIRSLNALQAEMLGNAKNQYAPLLLELEQAKQKKDSKGEIAARVKLQELGQFADRLKTVTDIYSNFRSEAKQALDKGEIYEEEFNKWDKAFQNGFQGVKGGMDENFKPMLAFIDQDGDGENDIQDVASFDNITSYKSLPRFLKKASMENMAKGIADTYKNSIESTTTDNGYRSQKTVKPKEEVLKTAVHNRLYDGEGGYSDLMKSLAFSKGHGYNITPEIAKGIENEMLQTSMGMYKTEDTENVTVSGGGGSSDKPVNTFDTLTKNRIRPNQNEWGDKVKNISSQNRYSIQPSKTVQIGNRTELQLPTLNTVKDLDNPKNTYSNATVESYTVDNKGNLMLKISYTTDKGSTGDVYEGDEYKGKQGTPETKQTAIIRAGNDVRRDIANFLGISVAEMRNLAVEKKEGSSDKKESDAMQGEVDEFGVPIKD